MFKVLNYRLFDKLRTVMNLTDQNYEPTTLSTEIKPVINVEPHSVVVGNGSSIAYDISTGPVVVYTMPVGTRGRIKFLYRATTVGATAYFYITNGGTGGTPIARLGQSGTASFVYSNVDVPLLSGYSLCCSTSGNVADTAIGLSACIEMTPQYLTPPRDFVVTFGDYG